MDFESMDVEILEMRSGYGLYSTSYVGCEDDEW